MGDKMAVLCNQVGYLPQGRKTAVLTVGEHFKVIQAEPGQDDGQVVMEGDARDAGVDAASGDHVHVADFSRITQEGTYYVQNESGERSHCFRIGQDVYRAIQKDMTKALYYQRCGCGLQEAYAGVYGQPVSLGNRPVRGPVHGVAREDYTQITMPTNSLV